VTNDRWETCDVANLISPPATAAILRLPDLHRAPGAR
jgi:hypothetical protein